MAAEERASASVARPRTAEDEVQHGQPHDPVTDSSPPGASGSAHGGSGPRERRRTEGLVNGALHAARFAGPQQYVTFDYSDRTLLFCSASSGVSGVQPMAAA